ncbi:MAG: ArsR/SmtB family transcription factor [Trinickia sp.]
MATGVSPTLAYHGLTARGGDSKGGPCWKAEQIIQRVLNGKRKADTMGVGHRHGSGGASAKEAQYMPCHLYAVLRILRAMESTFAVIAEPSRRAILSLLAIAERSVGDIEQALRLSQPSVSKHLRVLREAGFVQSRVAAQRRLYRIRPEPLMEIDAWLAPFRQFWAAHLDALERHLDETDPPPRARGTKP